jgi:hypothetical protein
MVTPAARSCLVRVTLGAPPAVEVMRASGFAAFSFPMIAVQSEPSMGRYSSPSTLPPFFWM